MKKFLMITLAAGALTCALSMGACARSESCTMTFDELTAAPDGTYTRSLNDKYDNMASRDFLGTENTDWNIVTENDGNKYLKIKGESGRDKYVYSRKALRGYLHDSTEAKVGVSGKITYKAKIKINDAEYANTTEVLIGPENFVGGWLKGHSIWGGHYGAIFFKAEKNASSGTIFRTYGAVGSENYNQMYDNDGNALTWKVNEWNTIEITIDTVHQTIDFKINGVAAKVNAGEKAYGIEARIKGFRIYNKKSDSISVDDITVGYETTDNILAVSNKSIDALGDITANTKAQVVATEPNGTAVVGYYKKGIDGTVKLLNYSVVNIPSNNVVGDFTTPEDLSGCNLIKVMHWSDLDATLTPKNITAELVKAALVDDCSTLGFTYKKTKVDNDKKGQIRKAWQSDANAASGEEYVIYKYSNIESFVVDGIVGSTYDLKFYVAESDTQDDWENGAITPDKTTKNENGKTIVTYTVDSSKIRGKKNYLKIVIPAFPEGVPYWTTMIDKVVIN